MHIYTTENGIEVPSVTTILSILSSVEITRWANRLGFRHLDYDMELEKYAIKGTKIHECIQHAVDPSLDNIPITFSNSIEKDYYEKIVKRFNKSMQIYAYETRFTERSFVSETLGYGGTIDWLAEINGFLLLNDFKSSKEVRAKHLFQLGGYYNLLKEYGYFLDGGSIIIINDRVCLFYPIPLNILEYLGANFNLLAQFYNNVYTKGLPNNNEFLNLVNMGK